MTTHRQAGQPEHRRHADSSGQTDGTTAERTASGTTALARAVYPYLVLIFLTGLVVEFFLAGLGVFDTQHDATASGTTLTKARFDQYFGPHLVLGDVLFLVSLAVIAATMLGRMSRRTRLVALGVLALLIVQAGLAFAGPAGVRALHPLLALFVLAGTAYLAADAWSGTNTAKPFHPLGWSPLA